MITGKAHIGIVVRDLDRALSFYRDALGCQVAARFEKSDPRLEAYTGLVGARAKIAIIEMGRAHTPRHGLFTDQSLELIEYVAPRGATLAQRPNNIGCSHIAFYVGDIDTAYRSLATRGITFRSEPNAVTAGPLTGWKVAFLVDPDGYTVEFMQPSPPPSAATVLGESHIGFAVSDLDASLRFYRDLLGCRVKFEAERSGPFLERNTGLAGARIKLAMVSLGDPAWDPSAPDLFDGTIELIQYLSPIGERLALQPNSIGHAHVALYVGDIERAHASLSAQGVTFRSPSVAVTDGPLAGWRVAFLLDPDGITVELMQRGAA